MPTFAERLDAMNRTSHKYHVTCEFSDGSRGYHSSRDTLADARRLARQVKLGIVLDREGNAIYYGF